MPALIIGFFVIGGVFGLFAIATANGGGDIISYIFLAILFVLATMFFSAMAMGIQEMATVF